MTRRAQRTQRQRAEDEDIAGQQVLAAAASAVTARHADRARRIEREILKGKEAAKTLGKPIAFPDVRVCSAFFPDATVIDDLGKYSSKDVVVFADATRLHPSGKTDNKGECCISGYVAVHGVTGHYGLDVKVFPEFLVEWVRANMMITDGIRISFQVNVRDNGTALVTVHHLQLSGSHWLGIIHAPTVPDVEEG